MCGMPDAVHDRERFFAGEDGGARITGLRGRIPINVPALEAVRNLVGTGLDFLQADNVGTGPTQIVGKPFCEDRAKPVDVPRDDPHPRQANEKSARTAWWSEASVGITA